MKRRLAVVVVFALVGAFAGCAGHAERYAQGLSWHLDTEAQKRDLNARGFPQYGWF
jgi:hypothetical protein